MSRYTQVVVEVRAYYERDFASTFPRLASRLSVVAPELVARNPSLYELAGQIGALIDRAQGMHLRELLIENEADLRRRYSSAEELLAEWRIAEADRLLYEIEDIFALIERELAAR